MSETNKEAAEQPPQTGEVFEELLNESLDLVERLQGQVVKGTILSIENDLVLVDVGLKSEGHIPAREFGSQDEINNLNPGDKLSVEFKYQNGEIKKIKMLCRIDTNNELEYYKHGGILQYVLRNTI